MAKVIVIGDTHLASKNGSNIFSKHQQKFFDNVFFPYVKKHKYPIIQLGDLFDQRKYINFVGLDSALTGFFNKMPDGIKMTTLIGNHDISFRETLRVNSPELLLQDYASWLNIISVPTTIDDIDFIPWICNENRDEIFEFIKKSKSKICCGHFEIDGFSMQRGVESNGGLDVKLFNKYKLVLSGHFHTRSSIGNITYTGTPYELTWSDYNDPKGFHVLDTDIMKLEFIENPYTLYETIYYNGKNVDIDVSKFKEKFVKVIVVEKLDYYEFDKFISSLNSSGAYDVKIVENYSDKPLGEVGEEILLKDTLQVVDSYIDSLNNENKEELKNYMKQLHVIAMEQV